MWCRGTPAGRAPATGEQTGHVDLASAAASTWSTTSLAKRSQVLYSLRQPLGVVAGVTAFNFPVMAPMWMFANAIACANSFILKPSEKDPSASLLLAELWRDAGLPAGVFTVVQSDREAVQRIVERPAIAAATASEDGRRRCSATPTCTDRTASASTPGPR